MVVGAGAGHTRVFGELLLHGDANVFLPEEALQFLESLLGLVEYVKYYYSWVDVEPIDPEPTWIS